KPYGFIPPSAIALAEAPRTHIMHTVDNGMQKRSALFPKGLEDAGFGRPEFKQRPDDPSHIIRIAMFRRRELAAQKDIHQTNAGILQELEQYGIAVPPTAVHWSTASPVRFIPIAFPAAYIETDRITGQLLPDWVKSNPTEGAQVCDDLYSRIGSYYLDKVKSGAPLQGDLVAANFIYGTRPGEADPRPYFFDVDPRNTSFRQPAADSDQEDTHEHALTRVYELTNMITQAERDTGETLSAARDKAIELVLSLSAYNTDSAIMLAKRRLGLDTLD
ncbi:MAG TPA: hypothetical protein VFK47_08190, partial [Ktedonobacteraceae bacterium]|nr:hypothetical protein [Ktedonobacteraceae bacterium]